MSNYDFGWGDPIGVREVLINGMPKIIRAEFLTAGLDSLGYPPHEGDPELVFRVRELVQTLTGKHYKYVVLTSGATSALNAFMYSIVQKDPSIDSVTTGSRYFGFYPGIIKSFGLQHNTNIKLHNSRDVFINDTPSNPEGIIRENSPKVLVDRTVWDAAYWSPTFGVTSFTNKPSAQAIVGSFSKTFGLPGLRVGWIATDDLEIYSRSVDYITYALCGISYTSQKTGLMVLKTTDLGTFFKESKAVLDGNKEELCRLNYLLSGKMPDYGMFYFVQADSSARSLLTRAGVTYTLGSTVGADNSWVRINLAKTNEETVRMVRAVLTQDGK